MTPEQEKIYENGFIAGMQKQMQSSVDKAVNGMAQRPWVGLTDEELMRIGVATGLERAAVEMISNKLKEKNT
jgi:hypothetical protein